MNQKVKKIFCIPDSGTGGIAENKLIDLKNFEEIKSFLLKEKLI